MSSHRIELICLVLQDQFYEAIEDALIGNPPALEFIQIILKATSDFTIGLLANYGFPTALSEIIPIVLVEKHTFIRALKSLSSTPNSTGALNYLRGKFDAQSELNEQLLTRVSFHGQRDQQQESEVQTYYSQHAYGSKFALCFCAGVAADKKSKVLNIDGAPAVGIRKYDWTRKIPIQLDMEEMYRLLAVLQLKSEFARFANHGPNRDKQFTIRVQPEDGVFFATLTQHGKSNMSVQIPMTTAMSISVIILRQITEAFPHLNHSSISDLLETVVRMDKLAMLAQQKIRQVD